MISSNSRWDTAYAQVFSAAAQNRNVNVTLPGFSDAENRGRQLFMTAPNAGGAGCAACHVPPSYALAANSDSNGLDAGETVIFKSPALKNIGVSQAFMHDGRFATLDQVVEHYNSGIQAGPALDNRLSGPGGNPQRLNLSAADKAALVAFMQTLTDGTLNSDPKFSDPFKK
jgi:cytochrome c peroxidase